MQQYQHNLFFAFRFFIIRAFAKIIIVIIFAVVKGQTFYDF